MKLSKAAKLLDVRDRNLFPVPSINSIIRVGKIPKEKNTSGFWMPTWRITTGDDEDITGIILEVIRKSSKDFAIAFENEDDYLILSDKPLDKSWTDEILSRTKQKKSARVKS
ncbi:hypothetical protein MUP59_07555 [Candidatus Bathyarchaeota archaeon]|nr:hypothetical protein [Candidatus Bathyarchaeota archaeon]